MNSKGLALDCMKFAELRKAENLVGLDVRNQTSVTDFFVICSGSSEPHLKAIVNEIRDQIFKKYRIHPQSMDGMVGSSWIVLDYYDVIVHIMRSDARERYDLESFWGDAIQEVVLSSFSQLTTWDFWIKNYCDVTNSGLWTEVFPEPVTCIPCLILAKFAMTKIYAKCTCKATWEESPRSLAV